MTRAEWNEVPTLGCFFGLPFFFGASSSSASAIKWMDLSLLRQLASLVEHLTNSRWGNIRRVHLAHFPSLAELLLVDIIELVETFNFFWGAICLLDICPNLRSDAPIVTI